MLDIDHGHISLCHVASAISGGAPPCVGSLNENQARPWVSKAYTTRGRLRSISTEMHDLEAREVASAARNFGAVTAARAACGGSISAVLATLK